MRKLASIRQISEIKPIPDADMIELAIVDGWKCVTKKGEFQVGAKVIYCEIDSLLPIRPEYEFLRKSSYKKLDDREGFRLKTVKLRGQISQGLLLSTSLLNRCENELGEWELGADVTEELGIIKYEPPIPTCLTGSVIGAFPAKIQKTDEERIQNLASEFGTFRGESFFVSEKVDGTSFTAFFDSEFGICGRNYQYAEDANNSYWRIAQELKLAETMKRLDRKIAIQGELIGPGIQKNRYKVKELKLFVFNIFDIDNFAYLEKQEMNSICAELGLETVPFIGELKVPDTIDETLEMAEGKSILNSQTEREGLVWVRGCGSERISFKTISNKFLAREG